MNDKKYCVYCHTSPSGKKYVGITHLRPTRRWNNGWGYSRNSYFYRAILKYGWDNIKHEILYENLSKDEACKKEVELIAKYQSNNSKYGYNLSIGGESGFAGRVCSEKQKEAQRALMIGNKFALGRKRSEETRKRMSEAQKKLKRPPVSEERRAQCISCLPAPQKGGNNPMARPVICVELNTIYSCEKEAAEALCLHRTCISNVCHGRAKTTGGYHFKFLEKTRRCSASD